MIKDSIGFMISYTLLIISKTATYISMAVSLKYILTSSIDVARKPVLITFGMVVLKDFFDQLCHNLADDEEEEGLERLRKTIIKNLNDIDDVDDIEIREVTREDLEKMLDDDELEKLENLGKKLSKEIELKEKNKN